MSDLFVRSGETGERECTHCGKSVKFTKYVGLMTDAKHINNERHDGPCGLPCFGGGGVLGSVYKSGQFHGDTPHSACPCRRDGGGR